MGGGHPAVSFFCCKGFAPAADSERGGCALWGGALWVVKCTKKKKAVALFLAKRLCKTLKMFRD